MTEPGTEISLEDVRVRFMEAEARLTEAAAAVASIEGAAERLGEARDGVIGAGQQLGRLAESMGEIATALTTNATHLREGVDAIRAGDPAEIKRRIEELDASFTATQVVMVERFDGVQAALDGGFGDLKRTAQDGVSTMAARVASFQREVRILAAGLAILSVAAIVTQLIR